MPPPKSAWRTTRLRWARPAPRTSSAPLWLRRRKSARPASARVWLVSVGCVVGGGGVGGGAGWAAARVGDGLPAAPCLSAAGSTLGCACSTTAATQGLAVPLKMLVHPRRPAPPLQVRTTAAPPPGPCPAAASPPTSATLAVSALPGVPCSSGAIAAFAAEVGCGDGQAVPAGLGWCASGCQGTQPCAGQSCTGSSRLAVPQCTVPTSTARTSLARAGAFPTGRRPCRGPRPGAHSSTAVSCGDVAPGHVCTAQPVKLLRP